MMTKYDIYNIVNGVFLTFSKKLSKKLLCVGHSREVIDKKLSFYPSLTNMNRPDFILLTVFLMYRFNPSSVYGLCQKFSDYNKDEFKVFYLNIRNYLSILNKDITFLNEKYLFPTPQEVFKEYTSKNISFVTLHFFGKLVKSDESLVAKITYEKIDSVFKFLNFTDESKLQIEQKIKQLVGEKLI